MEIQKIIKDISTERFEPYLLKCNGDIEKAFNLYEFNVKISQTFYAPLSALEVTLRNKIDQSFKSHFNEEYWLKTILPNQMVKQVIEIEQKLIQSKKNPSSSRILAELNFGFWTILFNRNLAKTFWKPLHRIFENIPKQERKRAEISSKLNQIRTFRNRLYHYEPIIWDLEVLNQKHDLIFEVLYWINPNTSQWIKTFDSYDFVIIQLK